MFVKAQVYFIHDWFYSTHVNNREIKSKPLKLLIWHLTPVIVYKKIYHPCLIQETPTIELKNRTKFWKIISLLNEQKTYEIRMLETLNKSGMGDI